MRMVCLIVLWCVVVGASVHASPANLFAGDVEPEAQNAIDKAVFGRLKLMGIRPATLCTDAVFCRRVHLDVIGTLPTADEARRFINDKSPDKRSKLIDALLERDEFVDYWAMKWGDVLRIKAEFPINLWPNAAQAYHRWVHTSIRENKPYDQFARELLTSSGSNFRVAPVNFYRATQSNEPQHLAQAVALTFMGCRADKWDAQRLNSFAGFFTCIGYKGTQEWKEQVVYFDAQKAAELAAERKLHAMYPDATPARLSADRDPRQVFADWLITPDNRWFTQNIANRVWGWLMGRGVIHPVDDVRRDNPPVNPALLAALRKELIDARYDLKHLYRVILNSHTYQLSCIPRSTHKAAEANFAYYPIRPIEAEVMIDALNAITGTTEEYMSMIPEPFTFIPSDQRSIALQDGSINSPFLEMFGRPPRDTGLVSERSDKPTPAQRLHLLNSSHIRKKIEQGPKLRPKLRQAWKKPKETAEWLYLTFLSRTPTEQELATLQKYQQTAKGRTWTDMIWMLVNSAEFQYRH